MGNKPGTFFCINCKIQFSPTYSSCGKYCSNACQKEFEFSKRYSDWASGKIESSSRWLRKALKKRNGHNCGVCDISNWNSSSIILELDHIDGDHKNNNIENLRLICPNCHSQTMTYKNRNKGNGREHRRKTAALNLSGEVL